MTTGGTGDFIGFRHGGPDAHRDGDNLTRDMPGGAARRVSAQLAEHTVKQVSAILVNKADFLFFVNHRFDDPLKQRQEDLGQE